MVFVIAEIGVNWDGNFELAKEMMYKAKEAGCNAVKFQSYNEDLVKMHPQRMRLMNTTITKSNIEIIDDLAKSTGIEWFCTPMYQEAVDFLDPFVKRFKIRSSDAKKLLENKISELVERVLNTGKETIISSAESPRGCKYFDHPKLHWLYVVPKYPCDISDLDFRELGDFDGYSNHCPHFIAPLAATILGAKIIEIHITSSKSKDFIDNNVSFDYNELKNLVSLIRLVEKMKITS